MKKLIFIVLTMCGCGSLNAQSYFDNALLFSRTTVGGSARIQALGGSQISLGGDYSSALSNPAGLGMYNRSEFTISPGYFAQNMDASYLGKQTNELGTSLNVPGLSYVFRHKANLDKGFLGGSLGISFSRTNNLRSSFSYNGVNSNSSLADYLLDDSYNYDLQDLSQGEFGTSVTQLAFSNYLIDTTSVNNNLYYFSPVDVHRDGNGNPIETRSERQQETIDGKGAQNQWSISYGANFNDKFFVGAGLGIATVRYKLDVAYQESNFEYSESASEIGRFNIHEKYEIRGTGINFTAGLIYRPINFIQVGASLVTPTLYQITDTYDATVTADWLNFLGQTGKKFDSPVVSEYSLKTPMRFSSGITFISKFGFISGDIEMVNYAKSKYKPISDIDFTNTNTDITKEYTSVMNYRLGAEYRYKTLRVRAGYRFMPDPYRTSIINRSVTSFSGGLGVKMQTFFIDFAATRSTTRDRRVPYTAPDKTLPVALLDVKSMNYILTLGFTF